MIDFSIGIDIGIKGGIVVLTKEPFTKAVTPTRMPVIGDQIDVVTLSKILGAYQDARCHVTFEHLGPIHGSSKATAFSMGYQSGVIEAICVANGLSYSKVQAKVWQKEMFQGVDEITKLSKGKRVRDTKAMALIAAQRLFPDMNLLATERSTVPHNGIIDALLMAEYCKRKIK